MSNHSNQNAVPEAKEALNRFKYEVADELGVPLKKEAGEEDCGNFTQAYGRQGNIIENNLRYLYIYDTMP